MGKIILSLKFLGSPVWWPYAQSAWWPYAQSVWWPHAQSCMVATCTVPYGGHMHNLYVDAVLMSAQYVLSLLRLSSCVYLYLTFIHTDNYSDVFSLFLRQSSCITTQTVYCI